MGVNVRRSSLTLLLFACAVSARAPAFADGAACLAIAAPPAGDASSGRAILRSGCVVVRAAAGHDLDAPGPAIARSRAERAARARAAIALGRAVGSLRIGSVSIAEALIADPRAAGRTLALFHDAAVDVSYHADGGVIVRAAIASDDLVRAVLGAPVEETAAAAALVIDARGLAIDEEHCLAPRVRDATGRILADAAVRYLLGHDAPEGSPSIEVRAEGAPGGCELVLPPAESATAAAAEGAPRFVRIEGVAGKDLLGRSR